MRKRCEDCGVETGKRGTYCLRCGGRLEEIDDEPEFKEGSEPDDESAKEWDMNMDPETYLNRFPDGPNADLAREVLNDA